MKKVVSEISGAVFSLPWLIAKDNGLFEAEGIDMEFVGRERGYPSTGRRAYESKQGAKVIALRSAVVSQAVVVGPDSPHNSRRKGDPDRKPGRRQPHPAAYGLRGSAGIHLCGLEKRVRSPGL